jgi:hypothetical protein
MAKRTAALRVGCFVLLVACGAACQSGRSLPDAPSVHVITQSKKSGWFAGEEHSSLDSGAPYFGNRGREADGMRREEFAETVQYLSGQERTKTIFEKYLQPSSIKRQSHAPALDNLSVMSRATHAATRTLLTRDDSGKTRLNTRYLLRTLTAVAKDTASTPYWRRTRAEPLSDFGSTVGSDVGMNVWHEVGPTVEQALKNHTPGFVSRVGARIGLH